MEGDSNNQNGRPQQGPGFLSRLLFSRRKVRNEKDLQEIIEESEQEGIINEEEGEMLTSIFEFGDTIVREAMVPRTDMVCVSTEAPLQEILDAVIASGHSRLPVYEGTTDRIVGIIYAKDLLRYWGRRDEEIGIPRLMRTPYFVPETKNIEELLKEFRTKRVHLAIAVDEYGGTSGLITIEDLIEEIVGDIQDEYDLEEDWLVEEAGGSIVVDGRLPIDELEEYFDIEIPREKFDTVGGYLCHLMGHVPAQGEQVEADSLLLTVDKSDERTIRKVRISPLPEGEGEEAS